MKLRHIIAVTGAIGVLWGTPAYAQAPTTQKLPEREAVVVKTDEIICSCVEYVHSQIPSFPLEDADKQIPNDTPEVGGVVIFRYTNGIGHVAIIKSLNAEGFIVSEYNFHHCQYSERLIKWNDPSIRGFWVKTQSA